LWGPIALSKQRRGPIHRRCTALSIQSPRHRLHPPDARRLYRGDDPESGFPAIYTSLKTASSLLTSISSKGSLPCLSQWSIADAPPMSLPAAWAKPQPGVPQVTETGAVMDKGDCSSEEDDGSPRFRPKAKQNQNILVSLFGHVLIRGYRRIGRQGWVDCGRPLSSIRTLTLTHGRNKARDRLLSLLGVTWLGVADPMLLSLGI